MECQWWTQSMLRIFLLYPFDDPLYYRRVLHILSGLHSLAHHCGLPQWCTQAHHGKLTYSLHFVVFLTLSRRRCMTSRSMICPLLKRLQGSTCYASSSSSSSLTAAMPWKRRYLCSLCPLLCSLTIVIQIKTSLSVDLPTCNIADLTHTMISNTPIQPTLQLYMREAFLVRWVIFSGVLHCPHPLF